jgi:CMP-N-acetylneuraminic acid synthetase
MAAFLPAIIPDEFLLISSGHPSPLPNGLGNDAVGTFFDSVTCIVPAKGISLRLPKKNTMPFLDGLSLLDIKLRQLLRLFPQSDILVVSEEPSISALVEKYGVKFYRLDGALYNASYSLRDFFSAVIPTLHTDHLVVAYVTTPYLNQSVIRELISGYESTTDRHDSVVAVSRIQTKLFDGDGSRRNFGFGTDYRGSQEVEPVFSWIRGVSVLSTAIARMTGMDIGHRPSLYEVGRIQAIDIDNQSDWDIAACVAGSPTGRRMLGLDEEPA